MGELAAPARSEPPGSLQVPSDSPGKLVYASDDEGLESEHGDAADYVRVPRSVVYIQGFLLGVVALVFFIFGMSVGNRSGDQLTAIGAGRPCTVSGRVTWENASHQIEPDDGSVVVLVPVASRPDTKAPATGLRPEDAMPSEDHPGRGILQMLGGVYARVDDGGSFEVRLPTANRYYALVISRHAKRPEGVQPATHDLAELGRYFLPATELLGKQKYHWRELIVRSNQELNVSF